MQKMFSSFRTAGQLQARPGEWLTEDEMRARLPAIFADSAHESRSDRYTYVSTLELLRGLAMEGFHPTFATQAATRKEGMRGHTKHLLRLRRDFALDKPDVGEIVMLNSHGGQSSVQLFGGWFRFLCMNGHIAGDVAGDVHVHHKGDILPEVIEGAYTIVDGLKTVGGQVSEWKQLQLTAPEQTLLAEGAATVRFDLKPGEQSPVRPDQLLRARRYGDRENDLWTTFNRVQENAVRGGLLGVTRDANNRVHYRATREVRGIDGNLSLNRALWKLAQGMADLKNNVKAETTVIDADFRDAD